MDTPRPPAKSTFCIVIVALVAAAPPFALAEQPTRAEIAQKGKAAAALVQYPANRVGGTAFCVHPDGYFLTAATVLHDAPVGAEVPLVLDAGLKTQKVLNAHLVRVDANIDAALLRVDGAKGLPSVALGSVDKLTELTDLIMVGFPAGAAPDKERPEYPAVAVDVGTITTLHRKDGEITSFAMKGLPPRPFPERPGARRERRGGRVGGGAVEGRGASRFGQPARAVPERTGLSGHGAGAPPRRPA